MKLVFAIKSLGTSGGAERVFVDVVNGLLERGHDVTVATFDPVHYRSFYDLDERVSRIEIGAGVPGKLGQLLALRRARKRISALKPSVVVAFLPSCYVPLAAALLGSGVPLIASEHNVPKRYAGQPLRWLSMLLSSLVVPRFTAVSEQARSSFPKIMRRKMLTVPNPLPPLPAEASDVVGGKTKTLLAVGRLHRQKDHATLIHAFAVLADEFPEWRLRIVGDGEERERLERLISDLRLQGRVELAGTVRDIHQEYRSAQIYVIPSRFESLGLATVEAMAHGLPAVGFADCPGTNQLITDSVNGLLIPPNEERCRSLSEALMRLMTSEDLRRSFSQQARTRASSHPLESVLDNWEGILSELQ